LKQGESEFHDFLLLRHENTGFLFDRSSFFASIYLEHTKALNMGPEYLNKTIHYNGETLLLFELDVYLSNLFDAKDPGQLKIALISSTHQFSSEHSRFFTLLAEKLDPSISGTFFACKVGSQAEVDRVPFKELKLFPYRTRNKLVKEGILGCRFFGKEKVDYIIDLEGLVFNNLSRNERGVTTQ
jgi:hypothetical protein